MRIFNSYNFTNGIALEFINSCNFLTGNLSEEDEEIKQLINNIIL